MNTNFDLPMMMSAKDLQSMGFSRNMAYRLLQGDLIPVVCIGNRKFIRHETLLKWLADQEQMNTATTHPVTGNIPEDKTERYGRRIKNHYSDVVIFQILTAKVTGSV